MVASVAIIKRTLEELEAKSRTGRMSKAVEGLEQLYETAQTGDPNLLAEVMLSLTELLLMSGNYERADQIIRRFSDEHTGAISPSLIVRLQLLAAHLRLSSQDFLTEFDPAVLPDDRANAPIKAAMINNQGVLWERAARYEEALLAYGQVITGLTLDDKNSDLIAAAVNTVRLAFRLGHYALAGTTADQVAQQCAKSGLWSLEVLYRLVEARSWIYLGKLGQAREALTKWGARAKEAQSALALSEYFQGECELSLVLGDVEACRRRIIENRELLELLDDQIALFHASVLWIITIFIKAFAQLDPIAELSQLIETVLIRTEHDGISQCWQKTAAQAAAFVASERLDLDTLSAMSYKCDIVHPLIIVLQQILMGTKALALLKDNNVEVPISELVPACDEGIVRCAGEGLTEFYFFFRMIKIELLQHQGDDFTARREHELLRDELTTHIRTEVGKELVGAYLSGFSRAFWLPEGFTLDEIVKPSEELVAPSSVKAIPAEGEPLDTTPEVSERTWEILDESVKTVLSSENLNELCERLMDQVILLTGAERALLFANAGGGLLEIRAQKLISSGSASYSQGVIERAMSTRKPLMIRDVRSDTDLSLRDSIRSMEIRTALAVPLIAPPTLNEALINLPDPLGLIYADSREQFHRLSEHHLDVIEILSYHAAIALINQLFKQQLEAETKSYRKEVLPQFPELVGSSHLILEVAMLVDRLTDKEIPVLITGETGTGKDVVARLLHKYGDRKNEPFVHLDCNAIPETLLESELFGIAKGVATGVSSRAGVFEWASNGVLYLDHIEDIPPLIQAKLLRVLQEGRFQPVGSQKEILTSARIISSSRSPASSLENHPNLRQDLYFRLNGVNIALPSLRQRVEDIPLLATHFVGIFNQEFNRSIMGLSKSALAAIMQHSWPGNVRELENRVRRAVLLCSGTQLSENDINLPIRFHKTSSSLRRQLQDWEKEILEQTLVAFDGNVSQAAKELKMSRMALTRLVSKHRMQLDQLRKKQKGQS